MVKAGIGRGWEINSQEVLAPCTCRQKVKGHKNGMKGRGLSTDIFRQISPLDSV